MNGMLTKRAGEVLIVRKGNWGWVMENKKEENNKIYLHYNHTDSCKYARWTARESHQFMHARPWERVLDFYSNLVVGCTSLSSMFGIESDPSQHGAEIMGACGKTMLANAKDKKSGRWERMTFKIVLSYHGGSFDGWQKQPGLNTVQGLVEKSLGSFVDERKAQQLMDKSLPIEACSVVAGRTDKGVTALQQVCSFYTWRKGLRGSDIEDAINMAAPGKLRAISVSEKSRSFHPNFSAKWRRYFYIFPINDGEEDNGNENQRGDDNASFEEQTDDQRNGWAESAEDKSGCLAGDVEDEFNGGKKPRKFKISKVNQLLHQLEGKSLSYKMFARDTKASRSIGPPTECFMYHARATEARLPCTGKVHAKGPRVMCVELVANRFLRKMVRVLIATSIREAAAGANEAALLDLMDATCRRATAPPAPPEGLCLVDVGYEEFERDNCLII